MKKSVAVIFVLTVVALFFVLVNGYNTITGLQVLDLPAPPAPPGMEQEEQDQGPICGNDILEGREQCEADSDCGIGEFCNNSCQCELEEEEAVCGDGILDFEEECEVNADCGAGEYCSDSCTCLEEVEEEPEPIVEYAAPAADTSGLEARIDTLEQMVSALSSIRQRLDTVEQQGQMAAEVGSRIDGLESRMQKLEVDVQNLKNKPDVQAAFFDDIADLEQASKTNAMLSISLSVFVLLIIILLVAMTVYGRHQENVENKKLVAAYLENYTQAGYSLDTLRMHLRASGWKDKFIDEAIKHMRG